MPATRHALKRLGITSGGGVTGGRHISCGDVTASGGISGGVAAGGVDILRLGKTWRGQARRVVAAAGGEEWHGRPGGGGRALR